MSNLTVEFAVKVRSPIRELQGRESAAGSVAHKPMSRRGRKLRKEVRKDLRMMRRRFGSWTGAFGWLRGCATCRLHPPLGSRFRSWKLPRLGAVSKKNQRERNLLLPGFARFCSRFTDNYTDNFTDYAQVLRPN
jgi:hypothetical protein